MKKTVMESRDLISVLKPVSKLTFVNLDLCFEGHRSRALRLEAWRALSTCVLKTLAFHTSILHVWTLWKKKYEQLDKNDWNSIKFQFGSVHEYRLRKFWHYSPGFWQNLDLVLWTKPRFRGLSLHCITVIMFAFLPWNFAFSSKTLGEKFSNHYNFQRNNALFSKTLKSEMGLR